MDDASKSKEVDRNPLLSEGDTLYDSVTQAEPKTSNPSRPDGVEHVSLSLESSTKSWDTEGRCLPDGRLPESTGLLASRPSTQPAQGCCGPNTLVYCSHFLSAWGDRMWQFAVGLFLVIISPDSLQLTAIYGLTLGGSVLLLGPLIGDWVDSTARLKAAQLSLVLQTTMVVICAGLIYVFIAYRDDLLELGSWTEPLTFTLIICLASLANLLSLANTISVERDWVVEICHLDPERLAAMTSTMRAIDLTTNILAPIATGQIMTYAGNENGCIFIAGWNLCSVVIEYYLIWKVYTNVPALKKMKDTPKHKKKLNESRSGRLFSGLTIIIRGWKTYAGYPVMLSGLSLSALYMTVLGFDNVTVGYAKLQGLSESVIGIMMGGGGAMGILGALLYPVLRRWFGLPRTGMLSLTFLVSSLVPCVISIWLPGSQFDMLGASPDTHLANCTRLVNISSGSVNASQDVSSAPPKDVPQLEAGFELFPCEQPDSSLTSVLVMMAGIIVARTGLWISDLSITQMFMETVAENERGIVNGVQGSLNKLSDMVKFSLVIALPLSSQFGLLVILSFGAVAFGGILYAAFVCRLPRSMFSRGSCCNYGLYQKI